MVSHVVLYEIYCLIFFNWCYIYHCTDHMPLFNIFIHPLEQKQSFQIHVGVLETTLILKFILLSFHYSEEKNQDQDLHSQPSVP